MLAWSRGLLRAGNSPRLYGILAVGTYASIMSTRRTPIPGWSPVTPVHQRHSTALKWVVVASVLVVGAGVAGVTFLEQQYGPLDPFADGTHAVITNNSASAVRFRDATGTYDFVMAAGEQRNIVAPDYSRRQDALTFVSSRGNQSRCLTITFQVRTLVTVDVSQAHSR